jgi:hypothetical protein
MTKKRDFGIILSLGLIIAVGSYWFVKELPVADLDYYVEFLGEKLMTLVPQDQQSEELTQKYSDFINKVKEKKVEPEKIEQFAATIINMSNANDTLSLREAEALLDITISSFPAEKGEFDKKYHREPAPAPEKWEELNRRLGRVHDLEKQFPKEYVVTPEEPILNYRVDEDLNIIMDSRVRPQIEKERIVQEMEREEVIVWMEDMEAELARDLDLLEVEVEALENNKNLQKNMLKLKILTKRVAEGAIIAIDSLDLISIVPWDSIHSEVAKAIEEEQLKEKVGTTVRVKP